MAENILTEKPRTVLLTEVWKDHCTGARRAAGLAPLAIDALTNSVFAGCPSYHYVFDLFDLNLLEISPQVEQAHGLAPEAITVADILDQIHPDDMDFVARAEATAMGLIQQQLGMHNVRNYKISYCFRCKVEDGSYRLFNHQAVVLTTDSQSQIGRVLNVHTDISPLSVKNSFRLSLIGLNGAPSLLDVRVDGGRTQANRPAFSAREISVIRLVSKGLTSAEIGRKLTLSEHTIKNHRKRILKKADCQNMSQLFGSSLVDDLL